MAEKESEYEPVYEFVRDSRINSIVSYVIVVFLVASTFHHLFLGQFAWFALSFIVLALLVLPPICYRDTEKIIPWEISLLSTLPLFLHALHSSPPGNIINYIAVSAASLIIVVELHMFSDMKMTDWFIVLFVATSTIALAGFWAIIRWILGPYTSFPLPSHPALMNEFMSAMLAGILFGLLYKFYLRQKKKYREVG